MFGFFKKKTFADVFSRYCKDAGALIGKARMGDKSVAVEYLASLMYVLADLVALSANKTASRQKIYDTVTESIFAEVLGTREFDKCCAFFDKRVEFFIPFAQGKKPYMSYCPGHKENTDNPGPCLIGAFLDIFFNPAMKEGGYHFELPPVLDMGALLLFSRETVAPFNELMLNFVAETKQTLP